MVFPDSIEVAAGLVFVYLLISVITTIARESLEGFVKSRGRMLERGITEMLGRHHGRGAEKYALVKEFYTHPLIQSLYQGDYSTPDKRKFRAGRNLPSYISSNSFAAALLDIVADKGGYSTVEGRDVNNLLEASERLEDQRLKKVVQFALCSSGGDYVQAQKQIENWYDASMVRVSGWYRRDTHKIVFWSGLAASVILNINTFVIADSLYRDPTLRKVAVAKAEAYIEHSRVQTEPRPITIDALPSSQVAADVSTAAVPALVAPPAVLAEPAPNADMAKTWQSLKTEKDYIDTLGLPLGWNDNTLGSMERFFNIAVPEDAADTPAETPVNTTGVQGWFGTQFNYLVKLLDVRMDAEDALVFGGNFLRNSIGLMTIMLGWLMTAFAITLGAPFWFDILNRLMVIRSTQKPKDATSTGSPNIWNLINPNDPPSPPAAAVVNYSGGYVSSASSPLITARLVSKPEDQEALAAIDPHDRPREDS
ncbi:hypothetical protein [Asticcacaulis machinosus]|uniref:Uncharacterized protein n=1 Tax=Asticcacaulis machinosus TaxID=2984211 RepID=A0ABT5HJJ0_9CAUL|nr:hypothetical protein [Asticcacaulis machinosus]MDC7676415.1 hypothetical protein [Asticcacaulis machinosus]